MNTTKIKGFIANYKWVLVFALVVAIVAGFFTWLQADKFSASLALTVSRAGAQSTSDYKYDDYYALKAADEFGSTVVGWFKTPETAQAIFQQAGLDFDSGSLVGLSRVFRAAKISPNTVEVRFSAGSEDQAGAISLAIVAVAAGKASFLGVASGQGAAFAVSGGEPVVVANSFNVWQNVLAGLIVGLIFGFFVKTGKEYFKE